MPPDTSRRAQAERACELFRELASLYDTIESRLAERAWEELAPIASRINAAERALEPLVRSLAAASREGGTSDAAFKALYDESARHARALAKRVPILERAARGARDDAAAQLARLRVARARTARYRPSTAVAPRFTSRLA